MTTSDRNIVSVIDAIIAALPRDWSGYEGLEARLNHLAQGARDCLPDQMDGYWEKLRSEVYTALGFTRNGIDWGFVEIKMRKWILRIVRILDPSYGMFIIPDSGYRYTWTESVQSATNLSDHVKPEDVIQNCRNATAMISDEILASKAEGTLVQFKEDAQHRVIHCVAHWLHTGNTPPLKTDQQYWKFDIKWPIGVTDKLLAVKELYAMLANVQCQLSVHLKTPHSLSIEIDNDARCPDRCIVTTSIKWLG